MVGKEYIGKHLQVDAANRAQRTMIQGLVAVFLLGAAGALVPLISPGTQLLDLGTLRGLASSGLTAGVMAVLSYAMRRWGDPSGFPTPAPPPGLGPGPEDPYPPQ